jgi:hypothetical protein
MKPTEEIMIDTLRKIANLIVAAQKSDILLLTKQLRGDSCG